MTSPFQPILHFIFNPHSGKGEGALISQEAARLCRLHGWKIVPHQLDDPTQIESLMKKAADASFKDRGTLAACGGDGTLRAAVQAIAGRPIRFAAIPGGTFNLFARTHHIPEDAREALQLVFRGEEKRIRVGQINDQIFLINANVGLYAKAILSRRAHTRIWGRRRLVALFATVKTLLQGHPNMSTRIHTPEQEMTFKTPMIFIGNNSLQLEKMSLDVAQEMKQEDTLALFVMTPFRTWDMIRILFRGMTQTLDRDPALKSFNVHSAVIEIPKSRSLVSLDGEMFLLETPFRVRARPEYLLLAK